MADRKKTLKQIWNFIWNDDSAWSWLANVAIAFILIKFIVYPGLAFLLGTTHPVVAVVSESMEHKESFDAYWEHANDFYIQNGISKGDFVGYPLRNGFNKGDIIVLRGKVPQDIRIGDVIVFWSSRQDPIIHRVVRKWQENEAYYFQTKGDNYKTNPVSIRNIYLDETRISQDKVIGDAIFKIPYLGYIKIWFVDYVVNPLIKLKNG